MLARAFRGGRLYFGVLSILEIRTWLLFLFFLGLTACTGRGWQSVEIGAGAPASIVGSGVFVETLSSYIDEPDGTGYEIVVGEEVLEVTPAWEYQGRVTHQTLYLRIPIRVLDASGEVVARPTVEAKDEVRLGRPEEESSLADTAIVEDWAAFQRVQLAVAFAGDWGVLIKP